MSNKQEQLSAFVDGEPSQISIADIQSDEQLLSKWQRYHLLGDAVKGERIASVDMTLVDKIALALENEPTVLAPQSKRKTAWNNVVSLAKQSSQFAVAASVAAVMILGVQSYNQQAEVPFVTAPTSGPQGALAPVSMAQTRTVANPDRQAVVEQRKRINALLVDHQQQLQRKSMLVEQPNKAQAAAENKQGDKPPQ